MNLCYTLPAREQRLLEPLLNGRPCVYCVPYDLKRDGEFGVNGWVVVTRDTLYRLEDGTVADTLPLEAGRKILCAPQIDNGLLLIKEKETGEERLLCRFSMRHMIRMSYVARGASAFCRGETQTVVSHEREKHCARCGRVLPGTNRCPRCDGRGQTLRRFWELGRAYAAPLLLVMAMMVVISSIVLVQQYWQRWFIDDVLLPVKGGTGAVLLFFGVMLTLILVSLLLSVLRTIYSCKLGSRISRDLRARTFAKLNTLSLSFLDSRQAGELMNRVVEDSGRVRQFMEEVFSGMFTQAFIMIGASVLMFCLNWRLALLTVLCTPAAAILVRLFHKKEMRLWRQQWRLDDRVNNRLQDVLSGIRVVKAFGQEQRESETFDAYTRRLMRIQRRNEIFWATLYPFVTLLMGVGTYFVVFFGGRDVLGGTMTPGQLVQFLGYAGMLFGPLGYMTRLPRMLMHLMTAMERLYDILDEEPDVGDRPQAQEHVLHGEVSFEDASFGYKSYQPVLEHVSFTVRPGEKIGLVGASGAGKSTLINLLMRLYDVDGGCVRLDGIDVRDIRRDSLHAQLGVVLQETFLFSGTIYDNIRYAKPGVGRLEVIRAAKMANAHEFIARCPDGYDTYVGEHGYTLSGGERQRIAIARAILHDPRLLILDEATSSLDTETEFLIQQALDRLTAGCTTFAIAHRLSTLRSADRLVVIADHGVAEIGTHKELMRQKGIYYGLVMAQLEIHKVRQ